jgi:isopentenyl diphosphate isomerase/L-lactate dehydrogenase-like FMN-dependent dehydrogenase
MPAQHLDAVRRVSRRRLLQFLAASPLALNGGRLNDVLAHFQSNVGPQPARAASQNDGSVITAIDDALDVFDFEAVARRTLPPGHFGYLTTGTDDDATVRANREAFSRYQLRVRRLVSVPAIDMSVSLFGVKYETPIVLAPVGSQRAFHSDGELASARAARARKHLQLLSTVSSTAVEAVNEARGEPVWFQLYATDQWTVTRAVVARVQAAGCPVLVLTVDNMPNNRVTLARMARQDTRPCQACHTVVGPRANLTRPIFSGLDVSQATRLNPLDWNWDFVDRLRDLTPMKIVLKGIVTADDAKLALARGADGIVVSNHGGRTENSGRGTIECLREVVEAVNGKIPVLVDGGFRRGTDMFKALALGATAVCVGRPYIWGLAAFGQPGVEKVLEILRRELEMVMRQAGTASLGRVDGNYVIDRGRW